jgi:hypothetical protein
MYVYVPKKKCPALFKNLRDWRFVLIIGEKAKVRFLSNETPT